MNRSVLCYAVIVAGIEGSVAISTVAGRPDLLVFTFLMTYLIVSLLAPARRPKSPRPVLSSGDCSAVTLPPHVGPQGRAG